MNDIDRRCAEIGVKLTEVPIVVANYVPVVIYRQIATISGQLPRNIAGIVSGQVSCALTIDEGREAARLCAISILAALREALDGDLDRVERCIQLTGFVNSPAEFTEHPDVVNGASDLIVEVFGPRGHHARVAVGVSSLPLGAAVEVSATFAVT